ncbi:MAG: glycosyltransferase family 39 protein [Phycisphaerae bacterium]|nr:glycosyltransferase family 39 protein [Phycisphaerae bacterium]
MNDSAHSSRVGWSHRRWLLVGVAIYVLAVGVRLVFLGEARHNPLYQHPTIDELFHHLTAKAIVEGHAPKRAFFRAPGHLYFAAGIYKIVGPEPMRARVVQVFVASLSPVLLLLIGARLFGPAAGIVSGVLASIFWTFVFFSTELLDVSPACVLYLLLAYLLVALDDQRWWKPLLCGVVLGLGAITRPNVLAFAPVLAAMFIWAARKAARSRRPPASPAAWIRTGMVRAGSLAGGVALAIAPVTIRNYVVSGEPVLISAWGPGVFWATNNPTTDAKRMYDPPRYDKNSPFLSDLREDPALKHAALSQHMFLHAAERLGHRPSYGEVGRFYLRLSVEYVRQYPGKLLGDVFKRLCWTFNSLEYPFNKDLYDFLDFTPFLRTLSWLHFGVICPFGFVGLLLLLNLRRWPAGLAYYLAMLLTLVLGGALFPITARYRLPAVYLMIPLIAYGAVELIRRLTPPVRWRRVLPPATALGIAAVFCNANLFGLRPSHCEYLLAHFAGACIAAERADLVAETSDKIEAVLDDPNLAHEIQDEAFMPLFRYFLARGDARRASRYGWELIRRRAPAEPSVLDAVVKLLIETDRPDRASLALSEFERRLGHQPNPYLAQAMVRFGRACRDRATLLAAAGQYARLIQMTPNERRFRNGLEAARAALAELERPATSRPTSTRP